MSKSIQQGNWRPEFGPIAKDTAARRSALTSPGGRQAVVEPAPVPCREGPRRIHRVELVPVSAPLFPEQLVSLGMLEELGVALGSLFGVECKVSITALDARIARNGRRNQYLSTSVLEALSHASCDPHTRLLGVTALDLYVPILTYVFGEAQLAGNCALVSLHRLHEEYYGLPPNLPLLRQRLLKEAIHELGHTCGLRHCMNWACVMSSAHTVEKLDVKAARFCDSCLRLKDGA